MIQFYKIRETTIPAHELEPMARLHKLEWKADPTSRQTWIVHLPLHKCMVSKEVDSGHFVCVLNDRLSWDEKGKLRFFASPDDAADFLEVWLLEQVTGLYDLLNSR